MTETKVMLGWRDYPRIASELDKMAEKLGVDRSDIMRMAIREKISREIDAAHK